METRICLSHHSIDANQPMQMHSLYSVICALVFFKYEDQLSLDTAQLYITV